jgi:hypothetical protein
MAITSQAFPGWVKLMAVAKVNRLDTCSAAYTFYIVLKIVEAH